MYITFLNYYCSNEGEQPSEAENLIVNTENSNPTIKSINEMAGASKELVSERASDANAKKSSASKPS